MILSQVKNVQFLGCSGILCQEPVEFDSKGTVSRATRGSRRKGCAPMHDQKAARPIPLRSFIRMPRTSED